MIQNTTPTIAIPKWMLEKIEVNKENNDVKIVVRQGRIIIEKIKLK